MAVSLLFPLPRMKKAFFLYFILSLLLGLPLWAAPEFSEPFVQLNLFETKFNRHLIQMQRNQAVIEIPHYEIPLSMLELNQTANLDSNYLQSFVFERNGISYVRWLVHPEDQRTKVEIENWLRQSDVPIIKGHYFLGLETASRSFLVLDPVSGFQFSFKASTDTIGQRRVPRKVQTWIESLMTREISDYLVSANEKYGGFENFVFLEEPVAFGIPDINRGVILRSYTELLNSTNTYVPAFSVLNSEVGIKIAKENGSKDPTDFWNRHLNKALAKAMAELFVKTGLIPDSPHSQNFLVELDNKMKPTGRIVIRDVGDMYLSKTYFESNSDLPFWQGLQDSKSVQKNWQSQIQKSGKLQLKVGLLHYLWFPNWLDRFAKDLGGPSHYENWGRYFFAEFEREILRETGVAINSTRKKPIRQGDTFYNGYFLDDENGQELLSRIRLGEIGKAKFCSGVFL